jgi:hypothetical protein
MGSPSDPSEGWQPPSAPPPSSPPPAPPPAPPAAAGTPYAGYQQPYVGYQQPGYQQPYPYAAPTTEGTATAALICAIAAWFICLPTSIVAIPLAYSARKKIAASNGMLTGDNLIMPALIIAWINVALWALGIIAFVALLVLGAVAGTRTSNQQPFQRLLEVVPSGI